jgi:hypothetical protein
MFDHDGHESDETSVDAAVPLEILSPSPTLTPKQDTSEDAVKET